MSDLLKGISEMYVFPSSAVVTSVGHSHTMCCGVRLMTGGGGERGMGGWVSLVHYTHRALWQSTVYRYLTPNLLSFVHRTVMARGHVVVWGNAIRNLSGR